MKGNIQGILDEYLKIFPKEKERVSLLKDFLKQSSDKQLTDWNNRQGHLTVGAFVYCKREDQFLVLYHKDLNMYLYPGGHVEEEDQTLLEAAKRELKEETGLENLALLKMCHTGVPFDIDTHLIPENERVQMPKHYHFDFRYLFFVSTINEVTFDEEEFQNYKWMKTSELSKDKNYGDIVCKLNKILEQEE